MIARNSIRFKDSLGFYLVITSICLLGYSCKTTKTTTATPPPAKPSTQAPAPKSEQPVADVPPAKNEEKVVRKFIFVMPFELEQNFVESTDESVEPIISQSSLPALNFYEGAMMAIDSLKTKKIEIKYSAFDTPSDSTQVTRMLTNSIFKDADMVIGAFPNNLAGIAAAVAKNQNINLVLTQASSPDILLDNKQVALALASTKTQCREMVNFMMNQYYDANVVLIYRTVKREDELATVFREEIKKRSTPADFHDYNATTLDTAAIPTLLSKTKRNLVFLISSDEAFVSPLLTQMEAQNIFGIKVCGLPTWNNYESVDFMTFNNLQIHLFDNNYVELNDNGTAAFRKAFLGKYHIDPMPSAFNGFELVYNLAKSMKEAHPEMAKLIADFSPESKNYKFVNTEGGGFENKSISVLKITDYKFERLNDK